MRYFEILLFHERASSNDNNNTVLVYLEIQKQWFERCLFPSITNCTTGSEDYEQQRCNYSYFFQNVLIQIYNNITIYQL